MSTTEELFLPAGYVRNPPASSDRDGTPFWEHGLEHNDVRFQLPVYRLVARKAKRLRPQVIVDIGCGSGDKLAEVLGSAAPRVVGVDQESAIALARSRFPHVEWLSGDLDTPEFWDEVCRLTPDLVLCADVIEHLADPIGLLRNLHRLVGDGLLVLSTPDRARLAAGQLGPPANHRHVHEWTAAELADLVVSQGFRVVGHHHQLPRGYSPTLLELKRTVYRALHGQAIPDRRSSQLLALRRA